MLTGWIFNLAGAAVSWNCKRQRTVALSTAEAEYMAMSSASQETSWLIQFLGQFGIKGSVVLQGDNKGAIDIAREEAFHQNTKHISIRYHFIRDKVKDGTIEVCSDRVKCRRQLNESGYLRKTQFLQHRYGLIRSNIKNNFFTFILNSLLISRVGGVENIEYRRLN